MWRVWRGIYYNITGTIIVQSIFISGSTFRENMASKASADHVSALVSFRFPIHLGGFNHFISNKGGGISLLNSQMTVAGELLMDSNSATYGGGMSLDDICLVCGMRIFMNCNIDTHVCRIEGRFEGNKLRDNFCELAGKWDFTEKAFMDYSLVPPYCLPSLTKQ